MTARTQPAPARTRHVRALFAHAGFTRLLVTRLIGQFGDGVFQASLAGAVLFNAENQAHAAQIASGLAVVLLPYSLIGPFAGVLLDRWSRRQVLVWGNLARAISAVLVAVELFAGITGTALYVVALVVISITRFILSALSAAQPHVAAGPELPTANAFSTTTGTVATAVGGGLALLVRIPVGATDHGYALIALLSVLVYLAAALAPRRFAADDLGPDDLTRTRRESVGDVARGLVAGARHVYERRAAFNALAVTFVVRLGHGITTVCSVLLYRNYFHDSGIFRAGLAGLAQLVVGAAIGGGLAALVAPAALRHFGMRTWTAALLVLSAAVQLTLILSYRIELLPFAIVLTSLGSQGIKVGVDTTGQRVIEDDFRGRVFSLYDMIFNVALVLAAVLTALVLPDTGHAPAAVLAVAAGYLLAAVWFATRRRADGELTPVARGTNA